MIAYFNVSVTNCLLQVDSYKLEVSDDMEAGIIINDGEDIKLRMCQTNVLFSLEFYWMK